MYILIVEDDVLVGEVFRDALQDAGHRVVLTHDNDTAVEALFQGGFDLIVADLTIGGDTSIPTLDCARAFCPEAEIILVTDGGLFPNGDLHYAISDVAYRIQKPVMVDELAGLAAHLDRTSARGRGSVALGSVAASA